MSANTAVVLTRLLAMVWIAGWIYVYQFWEWKGWGCFWAAVVGALCLIVDRVDRSKP